MATEPQNPGSEPHMPATDGKPRTRRSWLFILPALVPLWFGLERLGIDVGAWLTEIIEHVQAAPPHYVALALLFKAGESMLTALAWTHVLRATYPDQEVRYRQVLAGYQGGVGLNAIAPAKAGTLATFGILRLNISGARVPTLISTYAVNSIAFTVFALLNILIVVALFGGTIANHVSTSLKPAGDFLRDQPLISALGLGMIVLATALLARFARSRANGIGDQLAAGGAILRQPRRYLVCAFVPALGSYACRLGYTVVFMAAFGIPVTLETAFLMLGARLVASLLAVTPGGIGVNQAIDVAIMSAYAPANVVTAASLSRDVIVKAWNIAFGLLLAVAVFGWQGAARLIRNRGALVDPATENEVEIAGAHPALSGSQPVDARR